MCIRHHTHWSVESVAERGAAAPFTVLSVWKRSSGCRNPNSVCQVSVQGLEDSGAPFAMV